MNKVSELKSNEIYQILSKIRMTGKTRADIMLDDFDLSILDKSILPPDWNEGYNEGVLRKLLQIKAAEGYI